MDERPYHSAENRLDLGMLLDPVHNDCAICRYQSVEENRKSFHGRSIPDKKRYKKEMSAAF
jgi:hypothetical protein